MKNQERISIFVHSLTEEQLQNVYKNYLNDSYKHIYGSKFILTTISMREMLIQYFSYYMSDINEELDEERKQVIINTLTKNDINILISAFKDQYHEEPFIRKVYTTFQHISN